MAQDAASKTDASAQERCVKGKSLVAGKTQYSARPPSTIRASQSASSNINLTQKKNTPGRLTMNAMGGIIFAIERVAFLAIMAVTAQLGIVRRYLLPEVQALYVCAERNDDARGFVARDDGHAGAEFTGVDVQVCAADAAGFDWGRKGRISRYPRWWELGLEMKRDMGCVLSIFLFTMESSMM